MSISALQFEKFGDVHEELKAVTNATKPKITSPSQVLIRTHAASVNPSDLYYVGGFYKDILLKPFPASPGHEGAGLVESVGSAVTNVKVGDRVHFFELGAGSYSQYTLINDAVNVVPIPEDVSFEAAAQLTVNPITAIAMLDTLNIKSGDTLLQTAAASSLARIVIELAKARGIKTINLVRRDEQIDELKKIGADHVINFEKSDYVAEIKKLTGGKGVKHVIDAVGGALGSSLTKALDHNGTILFYGILDQKNPFSPVLGELILKGITLKGFFVGDWMADRKKLAAAYTDIINSIKNKTLSFEYRSFDGITQFKEAIKHSTTPGKSEKTIILFK